jgi:hypothetical protein
MGKITDAGIYHENVIREQKAGYAARMEETRNVYKILVTRSDGETIA